MKALISDLKRVERDHQQFIAGDPTPKSFLRPGSSWSPLRPSNLKAGADEGYVSVQKRLLLMVYALWRKGCIYEVDYVAKLAEAAKKIVPTSGITQDQEAEAVLSYMKDSTVIKIISS